jgi:Na+/H+-dicarboxylate symporter
MKKLALHWQVLLGLLAGVVYAWLSITLGWNEFTLDFILPLGDVFVRLLKLIAVPLVLFSIIEGVGSLGDVKKLGRVGAKTLGLFVSTTLIAVTIGLLSAILFKPGSRADEALINSNRIQYELWLERQGQTPPDGKSILQDPSFAQEVQAARGEEQVPDAWVADKLDKAAATRDSSPLQPIVEMIPSNIFQALVEMNMLQIIFFAIFFGVMTLGLPEPRQRAILQASSYLNEVFVRMVWALMRTMPFFVFALMAGQIVKSAGTDLALFQQLLSFLLNYSATVVWGLALVVFVVYPLLVMIGTGRWNYLFFLRGMRDAQVTAFTTSSSMATLPVTMECVHNKLGVSPRISSFVLPIGATVNMDGTSLYQAVAVVALAQFHGIDLSTAQLMTVAGMATLASIGAAAIPSAGLVLLIIVLESVGLNPAWIALILPVDRILDMCRTAVNVSGDGAVCTVVAKTEGEWNPNQSE